MQSVGIFFGTDSGNSEAVAEKIAAHLQAKSAVEATIFDMANVRKEDFAPFEHLILGHPTWYYGELQSHWEDFWQAFTSIDFAGKKVACFGLGDQYDYAEYFLDAMGATHDAVVANGAEVFGYVSTAGFDYLQSKAVTEDGAFFVGLALDQDQQPELTDARIEAWVVQIITEMELAK